MSEFNSPSLSIQKLEPVLKIDEKKVLSRHRIGKDEV
jgi:hypothetical protein